jgi:hypothetical protein
MRRQRRARAWCAVEQEGKKGLILTGWDGTRPRRRSDDGDDQEVPGSESRTMES